MNYLMANLIIHMAIEGEHVKLRYSFKLKLNFINTIQQFLKTKS